VVDAFARNQARFNGIYDSLASWRQRLGIDPGGEQTYAELLGFARTVLTNIYTILVYLGCILLLVILALAEVAPVRRELAETLDRQEGHDILAARAAQKVT
jgi:hypothetical protein